MKLPCFVSVHFFFCVPKGWTHSDILHFFKISRKWYVCFNVLIFLNFMCLRDRDSSSWLWEWGSSMPVVGVLVTWSKGFFFVRQDWGWAGQSLFCWEWGVEGKWDTWMDYGKKSRGNASRKGLAIFVILIRNEVFPLEIFNRTTKYIHNQVIFF